MFNEELKLNYIKEATARNSYLSVYLPCIFSKSEEWELKYEKDLCEFTVIEIEAFLKSFLSRSLETLQNITSQLVRYTDYCIATEFKHDMQNCFREFSQEFLWECVNKGLVDQKFITRPQLLNDISILQNPCEQVVPLAIFEGICGEGYQEIVGLTGDSFQRKNGVCTVSLNTGRKLEVSDRLMQYALLSVEIYDYVSSTSNRSTIGYDESDERVVKRMVNARADNPKVNRRRIMNLLERVRGLTGNNVYTYVALRESGRIDMINRLIKENGYESIRECISKNQDDLTYRYGNITSIPSWLLKYEKYVEV